MSEIIGRKLGMTRVFVDGRAAVPVTVIRVEPGTVFRHKTVEADGVDSMVVGAQATDKPSLMREPQKGEFKKHGQPYFRKVREVRVKGGDKPEVGTVLGAGLFKAGDMVDVIGTSRGRGFQGGMKRHGFHGGPGGHGSGFHRALGSTGMHTDPAKVIKGKKMPGQMGNVRRTVLNLKVVEVRPEENLILVKGSVAGWNTGWVVIRPAVRVKAKKAA